MLLKIFGNLLIAAFSSVSVASEIDNVSIHFTLDAVKAELKVACVKRINNEGEDEGTTLFFDKDSYKEVMGFNKKGLTTYDLQRGSCENDLTFVEVSTYSKSQEIENEIVSKGGFKKAAVVFYNYDQANEAFLKVLNEALQKL